MKSASDRQLSLEQAADSASCHYCGLPLPGQFSASTTPLYCCFGCRFAEQVTREQGEEGATRWALTRLGIAVFFTMNVVMLSMALWSADWYETGGDPLAQSFESLLRWGSLLAAMPVLLLLGSALAENAWGQLRSGVFSTDALLLSGVAASYAYSTVSVLRGQGTIYFEVGCVVLVMVTLGRWFEATSRLKASAALDALERLLPETVRRINGFEEAIIPLETVVPGDLLRVLPGERFPTDGFLIRCWATVDEQLLTGESWPRPRKPGDRILGGSLNLDGTAFLDVTSLPSEGTLARLIALVRDARRSRGHWQKLADRVSRALFPGIAVAALAAMAWHAHHRGLEEGILAGLAVTLIACPCALGLATPLAVWTALGNAASRQVLFRSGEVLERLAAVRTVCLDKTGTLTTGEPLLLRLIVDSDDDQRLIEREAAALAAGSSHVLSRAISDSARSGDVRPANPPATVQAIPGKGLFAPGRGPGDVRLGSAEFLRETGHLLSDFLRAAIETHRAAGRPVVVIGWAGRVRGLFVFRERIRDSAQQSLRHLRQLGCDVLVLTGDHASSGERLSRELGIPVLSGLLPDEKLALIRELRSRGPVAMVGDGVNDAPSLAASDVGVAMGCGADISRDSAGVCLLGNDLERIPWAIELARSTVRTVRLNLFWSFAWNLIGVGLAAAGMLNPALAAFAMVASSVLVITNSLRTGAELMPIQFSQLTASFPISEGVQSEAAAPRRSPAASVAEFAADEAIEKCRPARQEVNCEM